jgi:hypothetical protein
VDAGNKRSFVYVGNEVRDYMLSYENKSRLLPGHQGMVLSGWEQVMHYSKSGFKIFQQKIWISMHLSSEAFLVVSSPFINYL